MVCVFEDVFLDENVATPINVAGDIIEEIRVGHPDPLEGTRIEIVLKRGPDYSVSQVFFEKDRSFLVVIKTEG